MFPYLIEENKRSSKPSSPTGRNSEDLNYKTPGSHVPIRLQNSCSPRLQSKSKLRLLFFKRVCKASKVAILFSIGIQKIVLLKMIYC